MLAEQNIQILHTLRDIIDQLDNVEYTATEAPYYNSSIGAHTRHVLDHYSMFIAGLKIGTVDYEKRCRNPALENCRDHAKLAIDHMTEQLQQLPDTNTPIRATLNITLSGDTPAQASTIGRELTFLYSHTTHHYSLIALIMRLMNKQVPCNMGYAPATLKHQNDLKYQNETTREETCAR